MRNSLMMPEVGLAKGLHDKEKIRIIVVLTTIVFLISWVICSFKFPPADDVLVFFNNAELMKSGMLPYKDFVFEFPPLSLPFFLIPSLFTSTLEVYAVIFGLEITLFAIASQYLLMKICEKIGLNKGVVAIAFSMLVLLYFSESLKKFDMIVMFTTILAIYFYVTGRRTWAYVLFFIGALIKMYPGLFLLVLVALDLSEKGKSGLRDVFKGIMACTVVLLIAILPLLALSVSFSEVFSFFNFHSDRGFQVESFVAIIVQGLSLLGLTSFELIGSHYTYDVVNPICDLLQPYWMTISVILVLTVLFLIFYGMRRHSVNNGGQVDFRMFVASMGMVLITFLLVNKVFSTQYTIWLFPITALLVMYDGRHLSIPMLIVGLLIQFFSVFIVLNDSGTQNFIIANILRDISLIMMLAMISSYVVSGRGPLSSIRTRSD